MKAVGFLNSLPIEADDSLLDVDLPTPDVGPNDLLVSIEAISVNPADAKRRIRTSPDATLPDPFILGYDAVGRVEAMGADVSGFSKGDRVWYAGDANRAGYYDEMQAVDHQQTANQTFSRAGYFLDRFKGLLAAAFRQRSGNDRALPDREGCYFTGINHDTDRAKPSSKLCWSIR